MPTGDGLLVRIKPPFGRLSATQAEALAALAAERGSGLLELTSRGALQLRGLDPAGAATVAAYCHAEGLAHPDPAAEARRSVIAHPFAAECPRAASLVRALEAALVEGAGLEGLPVRFAVSVSPDRPPPLGETGADIDLSLAGARVKMVLHGTGSTTEMPDDDALGCVLAHARRAAAHGHRPAPARPPGPAPATPAIGAGDGWAAVGVPFGALPAAALLALAGIARLRADAVLRLAPWRAVLLAGAPAAILQAAGEAGFVVDPADPRLRLTACAGAPFCAAATVATREDAAALAARASVPRLHLSGCAKGCGQPRRPGWTLVGEGGRYAVVQGRADGEARARGLSARAAADEAMRLSGAA